MLAPVLLRPAVLGRPPGVLPFDVHGPRALQYAVLKNVALRFLRPIKARHHDRPAWVVADLVLVVALLVLLGSVVEDAEPVGLERADEFQVQAAKKAYGWLPEPGGRHLAFLVRPWRLLALLALVAGVVFQAPARQ